MADLAGAPPPSATLAMPAQPEEASARRGQASRERRQARFAEAAGVLEARLSEDPEDGPTAALLERCQKYQQHPPASFDGVANLEK